MADLNFADYPERRGQQSANQKPSSYSLVAIKSDLSGDFVGTVTSSGWASPTGTAARTTFATYTAPTISAVPTQAEVQAIADAVQVHAQRLKALIDDLKASGAI